MEAEEAGTRVSRARSSEAGPARLGAGAVLGALPRRARPRGFTHTHASIAAHLEMLDGELGTEPGYLRKLVKRYGLPPT